MDEVVSLSDSDDSLDCDSELVTLLSVLSLCNAISNSMDEADADHDITSEREGSTLPASEPASACAPSDASHCDVDEGVFYFDDLPIELQYKIMSYLTPCQLSTYVAPVCKRWKEIAYDPMLWLNLKFVGTSMPLEKVRTILERCNYAQSLSLNNYSNLWELAPTLLSFGRLQKLSLLLCSGVSPAFVALLNKCSPLICEANFEGSDVNDLTVLEIACWKHLHTINLFNCTSLSDDSVICLAMSCVKLKDVNIDGIFNITDKAIEILTKERKDTLRRLRIDGDQLSDSSYIAVGNCKHLETFRVSFADKMTDAALVSIKKLKNLKQLQISRGVFLSNEKIESFFSGKTFSDLVFLNLGHCNNLEDGGMKVIASCCTKLTTLELDWCWNITDVGIEAVSNSCKELKTLSIIGLVLITDECLRTHLKHLPCLTFLDLQQCSNLIARLKKMDTKSQMIEDAAITEFIETSRHELRSITILNYYGEEYGF